jgi:hypothetical protein
MASMEASLKGRPGLEVLRIDATLPDARRRLKELHPGVVIFDLTAAAAEGMLALLQAYPGLWLIGVDPNSHRVLALCGEHYPALTANDLAQVIRILLSKEVSTADS